MKVKIRATSGDNNYPTICGVHEFKTLDEAVDYAYHAAKGINPTVNALVLNFDSQNILEFDADTDKWNRADYDLIIEIYDDYRE